MWLFDTRPRRRQGGATATVLLLLLVLSALLGFNYYRNARIDRESDARSRPYAKYSDQDLTLMAEGYRMALADAQRKQIGGRVGTRDRHFFGEQIKEFERVQRETRRVRDRAIEVAEIQSQLDQLEAELQHRQGGGAVMTHLTRLFRI